MTLKINNLNRDAEDYLIEFVHGEQEADRNWYSPIVDVQSIEDAVQWLTDNEYDWKEMVLKFAPNQKWDGIGSKPFQPLRNSVVTIAAVLISAMNSARKNSPNFMLA